MSDIIQILSRIVAFCARNRSLRWTL